MNNKWYKFLIIEGEEIKINPESIYSSKEEKQKFVDTWKKSSFFRERLYNDIIKLEIDSVFKSLPRDQQINLYKVIKSTQSAYDNYGQEQREVSEIIQDFQRNFSNRTAILTLMASQVYYLLKKYFRLVSEDEFKQFFLNDKNKPLQWVAAYYYLYDNFPDYIPSIPQISYGPESETKQNRVYNLGIITKYYPIPDDLIKPGTILDQIKIKNHIGSGDFGHVFSTEDGRAIKIFEGGVNMQQDLKRMKKVSSELFSGKGSIEDMPYFDNGKIDNTRLYYVIMPEIIPLRNAPFFKQSDIFHDAASMNKRVARQLTNIFNSAPSYKKYRDLFMAELKKDAEYTGSYDFDSEVSKYSDTIEKIIQAGYRAYKKFKGIDLHSGNIGYLRQKPGTFFYFDM